MSHAPDGQTIDAAPVLLGLAEVYLTRSDYAAAAPLLQRAVDLQERLLGATHPDLAPTLDLAAIIAIAQKRWPDAENLLGRELVIHQLAGDESLRERATCLESLSHVYAEQRQLPKAEAALAEALQVRERMLGKDDPDLFEYIIGLADFNRTIGNQAKAEALFRRVAGANIAPPDPTAQLTADALTALGEIAVAKGDLKRAEQALRRALEYNEALFGPNHIRTAAALVSLAVCLETDTRFEEAEPLLQRALAIQEQALGADHLDLAPTLARLGEVCGYRGEFALSLRSYQRALAIREKRLGERHPDVAVTLNDMAAVHQTMGERGKAAKLYRRALTILRNLYGDDHPLTISVRNNYESLRGEEEP
jgi:tetratricopeptide (TPR) repeat protein